jgi:hypothetical protein
MFRFLLPTRSTSHQARRKTRSAAPAVEALEGRQLLYATLGGKFVYNTVTYSFAGDGINIGGTPSNLFGTLANQGISGEQLECTIAKAFATWQQYANVNPVPVGDLNGEPFGFSGDQQGDPNVGDIRIGGMALSGGVLAEAFYPPNFNGGTIAGDIVLNTNQSWTTSGGNGYDLETVVLHEIGHALGLGHSTVTSPWPIMAPTYNGVDQTPTADDQSAIQAVWGTRTAASNNSAYAASNITSQLNSQNQLALPNRSIANASNSEWFYITSPINGPLTVTVQSANLSSLAPKLVLYSGSYPNLNALATVSAPYQYGATVSTAVQVTLGQGYYIRVMGANAGPGSAGNYGLQVNFNGPAMSPFAKPYTTVAPQPDQGGGSSNDSVPSQSQGDTWGTTDTDQGTGPSTSTMTGGAAVPGSSALATQTSVPPVAPTNPPSPSLQVGAIHPRSPGRSGRHAVLATHPAHAHGTHVAQQHAIRRTHGPQHRGV